MLTRPTTVCFVMAGLKREARLRADVPAIHVLGDGTKKDVDARVKPAHDEPGKPMPTPPPLHIP
jgi:hypothetical protein